MKLQDQEIPLEAEDSNYMFDATNKPFVSTPGAIEAFGEATILACLMTLQTKAEQNEGIDYLQVFIDETRKKLYLIEDGPGGAITALLPSEY